MNKKTKKLVYAAMIAALTTITTIIIRIPSPTGGYIHPGDGIVLLAGLLIGPIGIFATALGSAFTDFIGGYLVFVPATFIIKALGSLTCYLVYNLEHIHPKTVKTKTSLRILVAAICGEFVIVLGYFIFEAFLFASTFSFSGIIAGALVSIASVPGNCLQGILAIAVCSAVSKASPKQPITK